MSKLLNDLTPNTPPSPPILKETPGNTDKTDL
jgi:hypothetical protein